MVRSASEFIIGPRFARTRWRVSNHEVTGDGGRLPPGKRSRALRRPSPIPLTKRQQNQPFMVNALLSVVVYFPLQWHRVMVSFSLRSRQGS
jgi:hypothetical protein